MKMFLFSVCMLLSFSGHAKVEALSYQDHLELKTIVMDEILINDLLELYSDYYFEDRMIAGRWDGAPKKEKKTSWSDKLRSKLEKCPGIYRI